MTAAVERIKRDIQALEPGQVNELLRDLQATYAPPTEGVDDAWDAEILSRVREVEEGRVKLVAGSDFQRNTDALFAELGIKRAM